MSEEKPFDFNALIETAIKIATQPRQFYQDMPKSGGYTEPLIFIAVMAVVTGLIVALISMIGFSPIGAMGFGLFSIILLPIFAIIGCFIVALVMFVIWKLMGSTENYETAFRCVAYSSVTFPLTPILGLIPYLGGMVMNVWLVLLMIYASICVHNLESKKSMIVIGVFGALLILMNISGERTQRQFAAKYEDFTQEMGNIEDMTPEEIGEITGQFLEGLKKASESE